MMSMHTLRAMTTAVFAVVSICSAFGNDDPVAAKDAIVRCGNARFTVLTDRLIRMEYAADGKFEDRATLTFVNRRLLVPSFRKTVSGDGVVIDTGKVKLEYRGGEFSPTTLSATIKGDFSWVYGAKPTGNLLGTTRTLDNCGDFSTLMSRMEQGLLSRDGWAVVDDSKSLCFVPAEGRCWNQWIAERGETKTDLYLFAYGHAYRDALNDYTKVAGKIPMLPRWAFGYWWSRYWQYSDLEIKDLVGTIERLGIPIDVFIIDMDWHETWDGRFGDKDEFGQPIGWTGYTWKKELFPAPEKLLGWLHDHNLVTALNLHPASGIQPYEEPYERFCKDYGWDTSEKKAVPYRGSELKWADSYFKTVLEPLEDQGVDFWWLDWQQWIYSKYVPHLNCTFWLNYYFYQHSAAAANGARPFIYHRWGGLGSHRYQAGFSGDTHVKWDVLGYLPFFTATAANVGYGYWGHDIGGHMCPGDRGHDPELFTRWLQSAVFTPIFKTHYCKDASIERRIWTYPEHQFHMLDAIRLRYDLTPYIYWESRRCYNTGVSLCHPLYWDWPEVEETYDRTYPELMFGNDILAVTVASPTDPNTAMSEVVFYLPEGKWFDMATGELLEGGRELRRCYTIAENPYFVKAGAIIPMNPKDVRNLKREPAGYVFQITPGAVNGSSILYEDAGDSLAYTNDWSKAKDGWSQTRVEWARSDDGTRLIAEIKPRNGKYEGMARRRAYEFRLPNVFPPERVTVNGRDAKWSYDGRDVTLSVFTPEVACGSTTRLELVFSKSAVAAEPQLNGKKALFRRLDAVTAEMKLQYPGEKLPPEYLRLTSAPGVIESYPERAVETIGSVAANLETFLARLEELKGIFTPRFYSSAKARLAGADVTWHRPITARIAEIFVDYETEAAATTLTPAFGWRTDCADARRVQKASRLIVRDGESVMWDTGIEIGESASGIVYDGLPLEPGHTYTVSVKTRDQFYDWTEWQTAEFTTGDALAAVGHGRSDRLGFTSSVETFNAAFAATKRGTGIDFGLSDDRIFIDEEIYLPHAIYTLWGDSRPMNDSWDALREFATALPKRKWQNDHERLVRTTMDMWYLKEMSTCRHSVQDQEFFADIENSARAEFAERFVDNGFLKKDITDLRLMLDALHARFVWHLVNPDGKADLIRRIREKLAENNYHVEGGRDFIGYLLDVLVFDCEAPDVAYTVALNAEPEQIPSEWLIKVVGGIRPGDLREEPGFKRFDLAPCFDRRVGSASASYRSVYGEIRSEWKFDGKAFTWTFTVPANTKAVIRVSSHPWHCPEYGPGTHTIVEPLE